MTTKAKLAAVPDPAPPETQRLELTGKLKGHWVEYRVIPTTREYIAFWGDDEGAIYNAAAARVVEHSFGGDIRDQPVPVMIEIIRAWTQRDKDSLLDPTPADD